MIKVINWLQWAQQTRKLKHEMKISAKYKCTHYSENVGCKDFHCPRFHQNQMYLGFKKQYLAARDLRDEAFRNIFTKSK